MESYNRVLNGKIRPSGDFWAFVTALQQEHHLKLSTLNSVLNGNSAVYRAKPKQQIKKDYKLKKLWADLEDKNISSEVFLQFVVKMKKDSLQVIKQNAQGNNESDTDDFYENRNDGSDDGDDGNADGCDSGSNNSKGEVTNPLCQICHVHRANALFMACRHMYACKDCAEKQQHLKEKLGIFTCSVCRHPVVKLITANAN